MARRSIVWITLESVRRDHTSLGDHVRDTTPQLSSLASRGHDFDRCFSHDIWTRSSSASILTGHAPSAHQTWAKDAKLPSAIQTIPEALRREGYRTVGITSNGQISSATGLDRGFDAFQYLTKTTLLEEVAPLSLLKWAVNFRRHSGGFTLDGSRHCLGYLETEVAKGHIDAAARSDEPLFLYIHLGDSHHAYVPPVAWRDTFAEDLPMSIEDAVSVAVRMSDRLHEYTAMDDPFSEEEWQALQVMYDMSISYVDHLTGRIVEYARDRLVDPIFVVTADHGELFGECGLLAHMLCINDAVTHVPLVVEGIEDLPDGRMIQHADVMELLCSELGVDHGVPAGRDLREAPREVAVTQRSGARAQSKLELLAEHSDDFPTGSFLAGDVTSLRTEDWRYERSDAGSRLFGLPEETTDVSEAYPDIAEQFEARSAAWLREFGQPVSRPGTARFDEGTATQLRDLGYVE